MLECNCKSVMAGVLINEMRFEWNYEFPPEPDEEENEE